MICRRRFRTAQEFRTPEIRTTPEYIAHVKYITLSADERLIEAARRRARTEHTTLNEAFRSWLADYAEADRHLQRLDEVMASLRVRQ